MTVVSNRKEATLRVALVGMYLAAIVAANLSSSHWGPEASIYNAFLFIGLTLTTRDRLHDLWGENRVRNMVLLIAGGSALSFAAAHAFAGTAPPEVVAKVALGSLCAFAAAESVDAVVYHLMRRLSWLERANGSNLISAAVDSLVFPTVAFGGLMWSITFGQFAAKVAGGVLFSMLLTYMRRPQEAIA